MNYNYSCPVNELDSIRRARGTRSCRSAFYRLAQNRSETALRLINDDALQFASLYILWPAIEELGFRGSLCERNQIALHLCERMTREKKAGNDQEPALSLDSEEVHNVLLWMFETGTADDGLNEEFDLILDTTASILIKTHHEKRILPQVADLIFRRNRKDSYLHDLTWAYFQSREPDSLRYIAKRLLSHDRRDAELAATLLHIEPSELRTVRGCHNKYRELNRWIDENKPYLYFTGESLNLTNSPAVCHVDLGAKYLNKAISPRSRKPLSPLTEEEDSCLKHFRERQDDEKEVLADYSRRLHESDLNSWQQWLHNPVGEQIRIAKNGGRDAS
ncbi:hypothetical protein [Caproiciproducens sp. LBM24188]